MFGLPPVLPLAAIAAEPDAWAEQRAAMVDDQIAARGLVDPDVLRAMRVVPREKFVPADVRGYAYADSALPIGWDQTISQPYIVALMSDLADVKRGDRVLEIGTGSGYQAAVLAEIGCDVYSIEIVAPLAERARKDLDANGYSAVHTRTGDGYRGWPEAAPFEAILVTAAPDHVPQPLKEQLAVGGRLVIPVGGRGVQEMTVIERTERGWETTITSAVRFVPMTGEAEK